MAEKVLQFAQPDITAAEINAVMEVMQSGWLTTGPKAAQFESDLVAYLGGRLHAVAVNSATAGLHLALEGIGLGPGDEVITTTLTFTATAEVVRYLGADPVFVDVDAHTLNMRPDCVAAAMSPRTKAIIPVHFAGLACDMDDILEIASRGGVAVLEDAAHALPASYRETPVGQFASRATVFSFYANKTMTTGEGGMVITRDAELATRMRTMRLHGINRDAFDRFTSTSPAWFYEVVAPGFKYNLTDIAAAIGIEQLKRLDGMAAQRNALAERYFEKLESLPLILPARPRGQDQHAWHLFVVRLSDHTEHGRDDVIRELSARGIGTSVHYTPLHRHPYWRERYGLQAESFPEAERAYLRMITLPLYSRMTEADVDRVAAALKEVLA